MKFKKWEDNLYLFNYRRTYTEPVEYFHAHEGLELLYIHEGSGKYIIDDRVFSLQPGTLIVIKPFQVHYIRMIVPPIYIRSLLKIKVSFIEQFSALFPQFTSFLSQMLEQKMTVQVFHLSGKHSVQVDSQFLQLHEQIRLGPPNLRKEGVMLFFLNFFMFFQTQIYIPGENAAPAPWTLSRATKQINSILKWIDQHYKTSFTIPFMASELHFSPNYLSKLFKEQIGKTIMEYTNEKRLEEARMLLQLRSHSVEEICKETGFTYTSYFIQMFKKKYGLTPHRYRERLESQRDSLIE
ncbi:helix-turn-helix domain-containing protein [Paenibacillus allorhizosphaerae]|nr:AraC family transcriptional regulator [Paenibacillus allorhizosphaerae]